MLRGVGYEKLNRGGRASADVVQNAEVFAGPNKRGFFNGSGFQRMFVHQRSRFFQKFWKITIDLLIAQEQVAIKLRKAKILPAGLRNRITIR